MRKINLPNDIVFTKKMSLDIKGHLVKAKPDFTSCIEEIKNLLKTKFPEGETTGELLLKLNREFNSLQTIFDSLIKEKNNMQYQYESLLKQDEKNIRSLYSHLFQEKLNKDVLDNRVKVLMEKENEYELIKKKTGVFVCDGELICNERKDNEIIILRTENSTLKNVIGKNEEEIQKKNEEINSLKNKILLLNEEIQKLKIHKEESNMQLNFNDKNKFNNSNSINYITINKIQNKGINRTINLNKNKNRTKYKNKGVFSPNEIPINGRYFSLYNWNPRKNMEFKIGEMDENIEKSNIHNITSSIQVNDIDISSDKLISVNKSKYNLKINKDNKTLTISKLSNKKKIVNTTSSSSGKRDLIKKKKNLISYSRANTNTSKNYLYNTISHDSVFTNDNTKNCLFKARNEFSPCSSLREKKTIDRVTPLKSNETIMHSKTNRNLISKLSERSGRILIQKVNSFSPLNFGSKKEQHKNGVEEPDKIRQIYPSSSNRSTGSNPYNKKIAKFRNPFETFSYFYYGNLKNKFHLDNKGINTINY